MESLFKIIYLAIQARLKTIAALKHINEDTGQLMDEQPGLSYPCALISFTEASFSAMGQNCQLGTVIVVIKFIREQHSSTASNTPEQWKLKGLEYYDIEQDAHEKLQGWSPAYDIGDGDILADVCGSLQRISARPNTQRDDLRVREVTYRLGIEDYGTKWAQILALCNEFEFGGNIVELVP